MVWKNKNLIIRGEIWKKVEGFPNYEVSNIGRVKALKRNSILSQRLNSDGYCSLKLYFNGKSKTINVHRLVALAFIPNPENKNTVNHKDCNRNNNSVENLEWNTQNENNTYKSFINKLKNLLIIIDKESGEILHELDLDKIILKKIFTKKIKIT